MFSAAVLRKLAVLAAADAAHGAIIGYYGDANCSGPAFFQREFYLGYCAWGATLTACSENPGWAVLHGGSNSLDCPGIDVSGWSAWTSLGNCVPMVWGWMRMESTDCVAPGNAAPPMFAIYDGTKCGNSTGAAGRPYITYNGNIINSYPSAPDGCILGIMGPGGQNDTFVHTDPATGAASLQVYGSGSFCKGPVYATYATLPPSGACMTPTTGADRLPVGPPQGYNTGSSANLIPSTPVYTNVCPAARLPAFGYVPPTTMPVMTVVGDSVQAAAGVFFQFFTEPMCSTVAKPGWPVFAGYCMGGFAVTACNSALGWATLNVFSGNDCTGVPTASITMAATSANSGPNSWNPLGTFCTNITKGRDVLFAKLTSADCSALAAPPLMLAAFSDYGCAYGDYPAGGPQPGITAPWVSETPVWPTACSPAYWPSPDARTWFPASVSVNANDGSVSVFIFGASDATCSGPVLMSFEGVTAASADTQASGRCVQPTKGATTDRTKPAARLRLFAAAPAQNVGPSGASLGTGVVLSYFNDNACTQPAGGWDNKALNITGSQGPIGYAGYCLTGYAISGGESNKWASMLGFAGNDCDTMPTMSAILVKGVCTPIFWVSQWNGYSAGTGSVRQAPSATERKAP